MLVRFEQDPAAPPGAGTFFTDDGRSMYGQDPDTAQKLQAAPQLDPGIAQAAMDKPTDQLLASAGSQGSMGSAGSTGSTGSAGSQGSQGSQPEQRLDAGGPVRPAPQGDVNVGPITTNGAEPPPTPEQQEQINQARYAAQTIAPKPGGPGHAARFLPKGETVTQKFEGAPYDQEGVERRAGLNDAVLRAGNIEAEHKAGLLALDAARNAALLPKLQQRAAEQQSVRDVKQAEYDQARSELQQAVDDTDARKVNPDRWFQDRGVFGSLAAGLAQAIGARAAVRGHTENFAGNFIRDQVNQDIAAQKEDIEQGKAKKNNALQMLTLKLGDKDKAEDALRLIQTNVLDREMKTQASLTQRQDVIDSANKWSADEQKKNNATEESLRSKYMGEKTVSQTATFQPAQAGGPGKVPPPEELAKKRDAMLALGMSPEAIGAAFKSQYGFAPGPGKDQGVDSKLVIEGVDGKPLAARTEQEAVKIREMRSLQKVAERGVQEIEKLSTVGQAISPSGYHKYIANLEATVNSANTLFGQGVVRSEDMDRWRKMILADQYGLGAQEAAREVRDIINHAYQARVDSQRGAALDEGYSGGKPQTSYAGHRASKPTKTIPGDEVIE